MKKIATTIISIIIAGVFLAGCGEEGPQDSSHNANQDEVKIAFTTPLTGNYAEYGVHFKNASEIAAEEINANGGINGKEIVIEHHDSKGDPKESTEIARKITQNRS